jgi:hypothetical protein
MVTLGIGCSIWELHSIICDFCCGLLQNYVKSMGFPVQARYEVLLREADKKVDSRVQEMKVPDTSNVVKSLSPGRRKTSTKDLARAAAKEAREAAKESVREAAKEAPFKELTVEADVDNHHKSQVGVVLPVALEDDQTQPKDLVAAMDSFDNLFCRRCLVQILASFELFIVLNVFIASQALCVCEHKLCEVHGHKFLITSGIHEEKLT